MVANWTTLAHLAISSLTNLPNWAVVIGVDSTPSAAALPIQSAFMPVVAITFAYLAISSVTYFLNSLTGIATVSTP